MSLYEPIGPHVYLRFIAQPRFISEAIRYLTNSKVSHVELGDGLTNPTWIGAHAGIGVQELPYNYCIPSWERRYAIPCTEEQASGVIADARSCIGMKYNYKDILGLFLHVRITSQQRAECAQFVTGRLQARGIQPLNTLPDYDFLITPEILHTSSLLIGRCTYARLS